MSKINIVLCNVIFKNYERASEFELLSQLKKHIKEDGLVHYPMITVNDKHDIHILLCLAEVLEYLNASEF
jgi:uncharacterized protein HemY